MKMMKKIFLFTCLTAMIVAAVPAAFAGDEDEGDDEEEAPKAVSKADWLKVMQEGLPNEACKPESFFTTCFKLSHDECKQSILTEFNKCAATKDASMPAQFTNVAESEEWGGKLGGCAGEQFVVSNMAKLNDTEKCKNPEPTK